MPTNAEAISAIESGSRQGNYKLLGPIIKSGSYRGDRAYGRYQMMGRNIPEWSRAALGRSISIKEFMDNPKLQDAIFEHQFNKLAAKHGPEGAARAWFAGEGGMNDLGRKDQLGTTVGSYGKKFAATRGSDTSTTPQVASAFEQYPQMSEADMARTVGDKNASRKNSSQSEKKASSVEDEIVNRAMSEERGARGGELSRPDVKVASFIPKKTPKVEPRTYGDYVREEQERMGRGEPPPSRSYDDYVKDEKKRMEANPKDKNSTGSDYVDQGNKDPDTQEQLLREIERATGIDRFGNPMPQVPATQGSREVVAPPSSMEGFVESPRGVPQQVIDAEYTEVPPAALAPPMSGGQPPRGMEPIGGFGAAAAGGASLALQGKPEDPALAAVQQQVQVGQMSSAPDWLKMVLEDPMTQNALQAVQSDPQTAQAADQVARKVVDNQAQQDAQSPGGQSLLGAFIQQLQQAAQGPQQGAPMGNPFQPVDYYNRGGGWANQGWAGGYYE